MSLGATLVIGVDAADAPMPHRSRPLPDGCRLSETMQAFGAVLEDPMMERFLQSGILGNLRREFDKHRPMLAILDCWERRLVLQSSTTHMDLVKHAAGVVYDWLSDEGPAALGFLQVLSIGSYSISLSFSDAVDRFVSGIEGMTITKAQHQAMVVSSEYVAVDAMLEDAVSTLVSIQQRPPALGPYDVALRRYECRVGNARVEFFSELRSMESYRQASMQSFRQGVAVSRHAETILASSRVLSPDGVGNAGVEFYGVVDAMLEDCVPTIVDSDCSGEADSSVEADSSSFGSLLAAAAAIE